MRAVSADSAGTGPGHLAHRPSNWNVPNALTTLRIVMVPFFGWALLTQGGESAGWRWIAYLLFALAMVTDWVDGELARRGDLITDFGKIADPIADKALTGMAFIGLAIIAEQAPAWVWWLIAAVVLTREWGITFMRFWLIKHGVVVPAGRGGKLKTVVQTFALGVLIMPLLHFTGGWETVGEVAWWVAFLLLWVAVALTVITGIEYVGQMLAARREAKARA